MPRNPENPCKYYVRLLSTSKYNANFINFRLLYEIGVREHDDKVRFLTEIEMLPFRACAMKNMQYKTYLMAESPKFIGNRG